MDSTVEERLKEILAKLFLVDKAEIKDQMSQKDIEAWDSMGHLMLITEVESAFGIMMSDDDITGIKTVGDIKRVLRKLSV
jgi:acyl carrier protein